MQRRAALLAVLAASAAVFLTARTEKELASAAREIADAGGRAGYATADLSREADGAQVVAAAREKFGHVDILVNNAGVMLDSRKGNETSITSAEVLRKTLDTNFFAVVGLTQALLPLLRKSEAGRIVNLSSILGSLTLHATKGSYVYDAKTFAFDVS